MKHKRVLGLCIAGAALLACAAVLAVVGPHAAFAAVHPHGGAAAPSLAMAFLAVNMSKLENLPPPDDTSVSNSLWFYRTTQPLSAVTAAGYFNDHRSYLDVGDLIHVQASDGFHTVKVATVPATGNVTTSVLAVGNSSKSARGQAVTVTASDTIATGLANVAGVVVSLNDAPVAGCQFVTGDPGDQAGAPAAGSFLLKTWKDTATADTAKIAATTFGKKVSWVAFGT